MAESIDGEGLEDSQQIVNTSSTEVQHPDFVEEVEDGCNSNTAVSSSDIEFSQQPTTEKGEREGSTKVKSGFVLQIGDRIVDVLTTLEGIGVAIRLRRRFALEDGIAVFTCREFGRSRRPIDYLVRA